MSASKCAIAIVTFPGFRNKGVATATAARFIEHCLGHGITPHWECTSDNVPSTRVAEKVGSEKLQEATFWSGTFE